jgi:hypothetical protein
LDTFDKSSASHKVKSSQSHDFDDNFDIFQNPKKVKVMTWLLGDLTFPKKMTFGTSLVFVFVSPDWVKLNLFIYPRGYPV